MRTFVSRSLCGLSIVLLLAASAWASGLAPITGAVLGLSNSSASWKVADVASVSLQPGSVSVPIAGQVVCPKTDFSAGHCISNVYWMVYQVPGGNIPNAKLTVTGLTGFTFNPAASGNDTKFGVLQCDSNFTPPVALCTNMTTAQIGALNLDAIQHGSGLDVTMPVGVFQGTAVSIFVAVTDPNFTSHGIAPALLTVDPTPPGSSLNPMPHLVTGGGYVTKITVVNTGTLAANGTVNFINQAGVYITGSPFTLNPGGVFRVQTLEADRYKPAVTSWAWVGADHPVYVNLFFEYIPQGSPATAIANSVGFNSPPLLTDFTIPVELEPKPAGAQAGRTSGVAISNPNNAQATLTVKLLDYYGSILATKTINIPAYGQTAFDVSGIPEFAAFIPSANNLIGTLTIASNLAISSVALQGDYGLFSATPIMTGRAK